MVATDSSLAAPTEVGALGIYQLKRLWSRTQASRRGHPVNDSVEGELDSVVLHAVGLGLEQATHYLVGTGPTFEEFERWIVATAGPVDPEQVARINAAVVGGEIPLSIQRRLGAVDDAEPVLSPEDLAFWDREGYVVLSGAVPPEACAATAELIWESLDASPDAPESWYAAKTQGTMVQLFQHPALTANRQSARIHKAFAQLWGTPDLWVTTDRVGLNPPERPGYRFQGAPLHWDISLEQPIPFGTQGILYLTDNPPEQGSFTCVPGFQRRLADWLQSLPPGANPRQQDIHALGSKPIGGKAGDLVIWHHALPHGGSPNRGRRPRLVHYINMRPARVDVRPVWI